MRFVAVVAVVVTSFVHFSCTKDEYYNYNITRCVSLAQEEPQINLAENHRRMVSLEAQIEESKKKLNTFLNELGQVEI
jgi:hypothetical protein